MTTVRPLAAPSITLEVGGTWALAFATRDADGYPSNVVTPTITLTDPADAVSTPVALPTGASTGDWYALITLPIAGRYLAKVWTPEDAYTFAAYVGLPVTETGMPTPADASKYLGQSAGSWSMADIGGALAAERSAQRARCGERAIYPDDLREALLRRVARNLAMRRVPLATQTGDADQPVAIIPGRDPEVRRLEGPYRRLVTG